MIASDGGINQIDIYHNNIEHFTASQLELKEPVSGLAFQKEQLFILTQTLLSTRKKITGAAQTSYYPFSIVKASNFKSGNFYSPWIRENGGTHHL